MSPGAAKVVLLLNVRNRRVSRIEIRKSLVFMVRWYGWLMIYKTKLYKWHYANIHKEDEKN